MLLFWHRCHGTSRETHDSQRWRSTLSARLSVFRRTEINQTVVGTERETSPVANCATSSNSGQFAREQVRGLVRRLFIPGWPRPHRQVVFSAADIDTDVSFLCRSVAEILVDCAATVCVVEANGRAPARDQIVGRTRNDGGDVLNQSGTKRTSSRQISRNLFVAPSSFLLSPYGEPSSMQFTQVALNELREEFDFTIIHGDCAGISSSTWLLAHLADGIVLGVTANRTRKIVAQRIQEHLRAANVRLLGIVLCERTFPIPEKLYRRV
jgi:Mrp family chromosome partitioning ATPase